MFTSRLVMRLATDRLQSPHAGEVSRIQANQREPVRPCRCRDPNVIIADVRPVDWSSRPTRDAVQATVRRFLRR
jgi:hypothetical protein